MDLEKWERNQYPHTTNTPVAVHEVTVSWIDPIRPSHPYAPAGRSQRPRRPLVSPKVASGPVEVEDRARVLAARMDLNPDGPIRVQVADLVKTWGTCDRTERLLTINREALSLPDWVLDGIIAHELAHLVSRGHGEDFVEVVNRYPLAREVDGYLSCVQERDWGLSVAPHQHRSRGPGTD